ncbi:tRNA pseudouridine(55) synthase TruB [bacterium]|nr:tRNA pseudouridine(55) synthase TruB [bacterium]
MFGILLVDKPLGISSHGVISRLRKTLGTRRIGHAGTLDPLATGLLVVAVGPATRFLQYLDLEPKTYVVTYKFGESTTTYDAEGEITETKPVPSNLADEIQLHLPQFLGRIAQVPPIYSAIKHQGKKLYEYARSGQEIAVKTRHIFIHSYETNSVSATEATFTIVCSGGTYIRSLAHDLGQAIGCGAHISELRRTGAGAYQITDSFPLDQITPSNLIPVKSALKHLPFVVLNPDQILHIRHGRSFNHPNPIDHPKAALLTEDGNVVGIANVSNAITLQPECVIPAEVFDQITANL